MCVFRYDHLTFCSCDLDLVQMTLIDEPDLDILKTYLHGKNEVSTLMHSKVRAEQDRHTDRYDRTHYHAALMRTPNRKTVSVSLVVAYAFSRTLYCRRYRFSIV